MEILKIVEGPLRARLRGQHFAVLSALTAAVDVGQILEEKPRSVEQHRP